MAYSQIDTGIKRESTSHYHDLYKNLHSQMSAEFVRNTDTSDSAEECSESPLDFSVKGSKKSKGYDEVSGSESLSSPASSLNDTGHNLEDRKSDNDGGQSSNNSHTSQQESSPLSSPLFHEKQIKNEQLIRQQMSPVQDIIGHPKTADPPGSRSPGGNGQASMFNELQLGLANANLMTSSFPAMAALMDPRRFQGGSKGNNRPFKAYPKDNLSMALGTIGIPHYLSSFANFETSASLQGLNLSSEEMFSIYKQQLIALRERNKYLEVLKLSQEQQFSSRSSSTLTTTSSPHTPSLPTSLSSMHLNNRNNGLTSILAGNIPNGPISSQVSSPGSGSSSNSQETPSNSDHNQSPVTSGGRRRPRALPDEQKDEAYWERRRKNNDAAKRSRDARRAKEDEIAIRAALLEQENLKLRVEVAALKTETSKLRCMLYNS